MTADQAVLAVALAAVATLLILAVPAVRRRRAQRRRAVQAFAWFEPARRRCECCCPLEELTAPVSDLSTPEAVAPLADRLNPAMWQARRMAWATYQRDALARAHRMARETREAGRG